jgi:predicted  nucleic acid-binding Zn-ribbon protein
MMMLRHMALRNHWKLGAAAFVCSFAVILAACTLALPRLSPDAEAALVEPLQLRLSPSLRVLLLTPVPQPAPELARPVEMTKTAPAPSEPAMTQRAVASTAAADEAAQFARLDAQFRTLKEREASLEAEMQRTRDEREQSRHELTSAPASPTLTSPPELTPEEIALREKIEQAKAKLAALLAYDTDQHPDVVSAREELLTLENRLQQLEIERWGKREATTPAETGTATAEAKAVDADGKILDALIAARTAIEQQLVQIERERKAFRASTPEEKAVAATEAQPAPAAAAPAPQPVYAHPATPRPAPPRLTWIGGLALGSPLAFLLALLIAVSAILIAEYSEVRVRTAAFRDSSLHPSS